MRRDLDAEIAAVVESDLCSGCGACCLLDGGLEMHLVDGYNRPVRVRPAQEKASAKTFLRICPGSSLRAPERADGSRRDPVLGSYLAIWTANASDPTTRFRGSSGGVLTA